MTQVIDGKLVSISGHYQNPNDVEALKTLPTDVDARNAFLDDEEAPADPAPAPAAATPAPQSGEHEAPDGEGDTPDVTAAAAPATEPAAAAPTPPAPSPATEPATTAAAAPAPVAQTTAPAPQPAVQQFKTRTPQELKAAKDELMDKKAKAFKDYSDGTMTPEDFAKLDAEVMDGLVGIASEVALAQANHQNAATSAQQAIDAIRAKGAADGIDYTQQAHADQFNAIAEGLDKLPGMASLSNDEFYAKVHAQVLALNGKAPAAAAAPAPTTTTAPARTAPAAPLTLAGVPNAATPNTTGGVNEELSRLQGVAFEERFAAMTPQQRAALLDE